MVVSISYPNGANDLGMLLWCVPDRCSSRGKKFRYVALGFVPIGEPSGARNVDVVLYCFQDMEVRMAAAAKGGERQEIT